MEKFLEIVSNPYVFLIGSALLIMGLTQLIKLIPLFRNNNWNISFPVLFGYGAALGWGFLCKIDIQANMDTLIMFGTGIGTLSTTLYTIFKKIFSKDYKMTNEIETNELYKFLSDLFTVDVKNFKDKTTAEKYSYIISIASELKDVVAKLKAGDKQGATQDVVKALSKFLNSGDLVVSANNLIEILRKEYKVPEIINNVSNVQNLIKPENK